MSRLMLVLALVPFMFGCSVMRALDFGGDPGKQWEFKFGWDHGIKIPQGKPGTANDGGEYIPETPEVEAILGFPNVYAGMNVVIQPEARFCPTVGIETCSFKVPYLRWFSVQAQGGTNLVDFYVGKRLVSIFEISVGPWVGWDFDNREVAYGLGATIIKF
jgi:hypothetical protein